MYDIIGDIHGCAAELKALLKQLGYEKQGSVWKHPERKALFLGDLINRGKGVAKSLSIVRNMHEAGEAEVILGNHEFNLIAWNTPNNTGGFLRPHNKHNLKQLRTTLTDFSGREAELNSYINWIKTLPLYFENDDFRAIHACWDFDYIEAIRKGEMPKNLSDVAFLEQSVIPFTPEFDFIECLLKGVEYKLPNNQQFIDNDGNRRTFVRLKWWEAAHTNQLKKLAFQSNMFQEHEIIPQWKHDQIPQYSTREKPLFLGHYCMGKQPVHLLQSNMMCLDYCVYKTGRLTAYRMNNEVLNVNRVVQLS